MGSEEKVNFGNYYSTICLHILSLLHIFINTVTYQCDPSSFLANWKNTVIK